MTTPTPLVISPQTVQNITGATVDAALIAQARSIIELYVGVDLTDLRRLAARDRAWCGKAIAYQAAWMLQQPDLFARIDVASMTQDGLSLTPRDQRALLLAPLARMAVGRVSWNRSRTVRVALGRASQLANRADHGYGGEERDYDTGTGYAGGALAPGGLVRDGFEDSWETV